MFRIFWWLKLDISLLRNSKSEGSTNRLKSQFDLKIVHDLKFYSLGTEWKNGRMEEDEEEEEEEEEE